MATAGDADGDGFGDVLAGAPGTTTVAGRALLFRGGGDGPATALGEATIAAWVGVALDWRTARNNFV